MTQNSPALQRWNVQHTQTTRNAEGMTH
jgi:hypothetical protein